MSSRRIVGIVFFAWAAAAILSFTTPAFAQETEAAERTVRVNCTRRGASIAKALNKRATVLTIEVTGFCQENIEIRRNHVILRGSSGDPTADGIEGITASPSPLAVVEVWNTKHVRIEDLTIRNGTRSGLAAFGAERLTLQNCRLVDNWMAGAELNGTTTGGAYLTDFSNNRIGLRAASGASFNTGGCRFEDNESQAVSASEAARLYLGTYRPPSGSGDPDVENHISGALGISARNGANVTVRDGSIEIDPTLKPTFPYAVMSYEGAFVTLTAVTFDSFFIADAHANIFLESAEQVSVPAGFDNEIHFNSYFRNRGAIVNGATNVMGFSKVTVSCSDAVVAGDMTCWFGGDAVAGSETTVTGTVTGCPSFVMP